MAVVLDRDVLGVLLSSLLLSRYARVWAVVELSRRKLGELLDVLGGRGCGIIWSVGGDMVEYVVFRSWLFDRGVASAVFHVINGWDTGSTLCMDRAEGISGAKH